MNSFFITFMAVAVMLCYAVPGWILVRIKQIDEKAIPAFAKILMYVCSPCLTVYTMVRIEYSLDVLIDAGIVLLITVLLQTILILSFRFIFRKKYDDVKYRVATIATAMGNCGFLGVPLVEAVMPDYPEAVMMSTAYCVGMNFIGWTLSSYIVSNDRKYMKIEKAFINPAVISLVVALPLFIYEIKLPTQIDNMVTLLGKMSAPMCMLIMGMRLGTMDLKSVFKGGFNYMIIGVKQFIMPVLALIMMKAVGASDNLCEATFILSAAPVASVVLNFSEMIGQGQKNAANLVLLGTILSIVTMPIAILLL